MQWKALVLSSLAYLLFGALFQTTSANPDHQCIVCEEFEPACDPPGNEQFELTLAVDTSNRGQVIADQYKEFVRSIVRSYPVGVDDVRIGYIIYQSNAYNSVQYYEICHPLKCPEGATVCRCSTVQSHVLSFIDTFQFVATGSNMASVASIAYSNSMSPFNKRNYPVRDIVLILGSAEPDDVPRLDREAPRLHALGTIVLVATYDPEKLTVHKMGPAIGRENTDRYAFTCDGPENFPTLLEKIKRGIACDPGPTYGTWGPKKIVIHDLNEVGCMGREYADILQQFHYPSINCQQMPEFPRGYNDDKDAKCHEIVYGDIVRCPDPEEPDKPVRIPYAVGKCGKCHIILPGTNTELIGTGEWRTTSIESVEADDCGDFNSEIHHKEYIMYDDKCHHLTNANASDFFPEYHNDLCMTTRETDTKKCDVQVADCAYCENIVPECRVENSDQKHEIDIIMTTLEEIPGSEWVQFQSLIRELCYIFKQPGSNIKVHMVGYEMYIPGEATKVKEKPFKYAEEPKKYVQTVLEMIYLNLLWTRDQGDDTKYTTIVASYAKPFSFNGNMEAAADLLELGVRLESITLGPLTKQARAQRAGAALKTSMLEDVSRLHDLIESITEATIVCDPVDPDIRWVEFKEEFGEEELGCDEYAYTEVDREFFYKSSDCTNATLIPSEYEDSKCFEKIPGDYIVCP